jgi:hypothetical protein
MQEGKNHKNADRVDIPVDPEPTTQATDPVQRVGVNSAKFTAREVLVEV